MAVFNAGGKVRLVDTDEVGTVSETIPSRKDGKTYYKVRLEDGTEDLLREDEIEPDTTDEVDCGNFAWDIAIEDNVVSVNAKYGDEHLGRSHAHIMHDGVSGVIQAVGYAFRRLWLNYAAKHDLDDKTGKKLQ